MRCLVAGLMVVAAGACGAREPVDREAFAARALDGYVTLPDVVLPDMHGEPYDLRAEGSGHITLLFVGYTYCPDVCPVQLANLGAVLRDYPLEVAPRVRTLFVTADPERDTPERLREWLGALHGDFVGLRPTREQVNALEEALEIPFSVVDPGAGPESYFVGHASQVLVFDEAGRARAAYPWGTRQQDWRRDLPRLVRGEWPMPVHSEGG
ncbi:MAG: SCO family protein [Longimicrobiales bacterium]|nr:SCO family protein [Longimicrobiales bacterium]